MFPKVNPKQSFPEMEENILKFWKENDTFQKSIENRPEDKPYRFYDGPPFITGTPHYGSLLSSIIKDIVPRYHTMQGKRVERKWGWDCHGLPIEEKVQKKLGLESSKEIEETVGIKTFIEECYKYTQETSAEWNWYVDHIGRWVDMENAYKTMDQDYMESVMWVFKSMWDKDMIYKGQRVSLYSWKLSTPISNFEVAMDDSYEEVSDPAITVMFPLRGQDTTLSDNRLEGAFEYTDNGELRYVLGLIKNEQGEFLMLKNKKHEGRFQFPGGKIDAGESPEEALKREIMEELGVSVKDIKFLNSKKQFVQSTPWLGEYYEVTIEGEPSIQEPHKHEFFEYFSFETSDNSVGFTLKGNKGTYIEDTNTLLRYDAHTLFQIKNGIDTSKIENHLLAWTTTPWTIPAHMSIAVNPELAYSRVLSDNQYYILATARVESVFKGKNYEIIESFMGSELLGLSYEAPFPYYQGKVDPSKNHRVLAADFVTDTDGTGIAHQAPEFGDVDFQLAKKEGVHISHALDNEGKYTDEIADYTGMHYQEANDVISEKLKEMGRLFKKESINHRVAMCPRSGTPLIYKAQDSWFINIQDLKDRLIAENEGINWQPAHLKHGQFLKSMEGAPDWCISRTRYWGTPMPIWVGRDADGKEVDMKVFGSRAEIEAASGKKVTDLHRPYIDDITWTENGITYTRLPEVLDVWMDSGSMPYAQEHYPFEHAEKMKASYPADFIVEYIGQVRAWFYVMHVCGVALFDQRSFTNVITTGIVNGSDGRKMSKSYGNYPDPKGTIQKYGADAIRFYMANSPLLTGGNMDFKEEGIVEVIKKVILPLWNTYSFFTTYANIDNFSPTQNTVRNNPLDTWIISEINKLIDDITKGMNRYEVTDATRPIVKFMDKLTNWYIRRSRKRFWKSENDGDKMQAYETLYEVLVTLTKLMAPFTPFVTEEIYKNLTGGESVHLTDFPIPDNALIDEKLNADMDVCQKIINLGLSLRTAQRIRVRQPLSSISIGEKLSDYYKDIIKEELNVKEVLEVESSSIAKKICKPNGRLIGPKFGKDVKNIIAQAKSGNFEEIDENTVKVGEFILEGDEFEIAFVTEDNADNIESGFGMVIAMDLELTDALITEGYARDIVRHIQEARKEAGYQVDDRIRVNITVEHLDDILASYDIASETLSQLDTSLQEGDIEKAIELGDITAKIILKK